jgi:hypothetical protein
VRISRLVAAAVTAIALALSAGCTSSDDGTAPTTSLTSTTSPDITDPQTSSVTSGTTTPTESSATTSAPPPPPEVAFRPRAAFETVRYLALRIGPREATTSAYARAADWVQARFESYGYDVRRQRLHVPAGNSWGIDVPAGQTWNVVATLPGLDAGDPHRVVSAHLDTVPQAPGAEDDGSGVSVVLELARMAALDPPRTPVMFVAFAAEEPRGDGDELHHFGSTAMVKRMRVRERTGVTGMVSLDRVGVPGPAVPVCTGGLGATVVQAALARAGTRAHVSTERCLNTGSDHWSFEKAGIPAARVGGTDYPAYHSAADLPRVVSPKQLTRSAALVWEWITG